LSLASRCDWHSWEYDWSGSDIVHFDEQIIRLKVMPERGRAGEAKPSLDVRFGWIVQEFKGRAGTREPGQPLALSALLV